MSESGVTGSVTSWIRDIKDGNADAVGKVLERYFGRLQSLAKNSIRPSTRATSDEEDVALDVVDTLCRELAQGNFPAIRNRDDLWFMMIRVTQNKVIDRHRHNNRAKRGGDHNTMRVSEILELYDGQLEVFISENSNPHTIVEIQDCWRALLASLPDERSRDVATLKLQGYSNRAIAEQLNMAYRTVDRKIELIAALWRSIGSDD